MARIKEIILRNILNSNGNETLEVELLADNNIRTYASSPSAIIPGRREVITKDKISKFNLNKMIAEICEKDIEKQEDFDKILNCYMKELGTNICLPFSLAFARLMTKLKDLTLAQYICDITQYNRKAISPIPLVAIFSGGVHNPKEKGTIQNIMLAVNIHPFSEAVKAITEIYTDIENELKQKDRLKGYGASSGMLVEGMTVEEKMKMICDTIKKFKYDNRVSIAIDVAAEHFYEDGRYIYQGECIDSEKLLEKLSQYIEKYQITYLEDPFDSTDEEYWRKIKVKNKKIDIVGDDLFATQDKYIKSELANGIIIKMNQVGTLTDTIKTFQKAKKENMAICVSQRSIETEDTFMCDLAVALDATYIKIGGPRRGDRIEKYNRLLRLEEEISRKNNH